MNGNRRGLSCAMCATSLIVLLSIKATIVTSQGGVIDAGVTSSMTSSDADSGVQEIILPMCKGFLPYTHTRLPNRFGHTTQVEVYRAIQNYWAFMDYGCSANLRYFVCSLHLPRYSRSSNPSNPRHNQASNPMNQRNTQSSNPLNLGQDQDSDPMDDQGSNATGTVDEPCKETCNKARGKCKGPMRQMQSRWPRQWRCASLPSKRSSSTCLRPIREPRHAAARHMYCADITLNQCTHLPYTLGSLPNLFLQRNLTELQVELDFYNPLLATSCSPHLQLFLCGTYIPFCVHNENPFMMPCKELCEEVHTSCLNHFNFLYGGLPWPNKLQCHRYPSSESNARLRCFMPGDV